MIDASVYRAVVAADSPIAYYKLDEASGNAIDDVDNVDMAWTGTPGRQSASFFTNDYSVDFSGDDNAHIDDVGIFALTTGTLSAWVKTTTNDEWRGIVTKPDAYGMFLRLGRLMTYDWSAGAIIDSAVSIGDGQWHHVAFVFRSGVAGGSQLYVDGDPTGTFTYTINAQSVAAAIGWGGSGQYFIGNIDEVAIFNTALSDARILAHYESGLLIPPTEGIPWIKVASFSPLDIPGLIGWYDFSNSTTLFTDTGRTTPATADGDSIKGVTDLSGKGNHAAGGITNMVYKVGIQNGKSVGRIVGSGEALSIPFSASQPIYWIFAGRRHNTTGNGRILDDDSNSGLRHFISVTTGYVMGTSGGEIGGGSDGDTAFHTFRFLYSGASSSGFRDNLSKFTGTLNSDGIIDQRIGANGGVTVDFDYGEVLCYAPGSAISSTNLDKLEAYLRNKWGTTFSPSNISGLSLWYDFADPSTLFTDAGTTPVSTDGQAIYQVNDKSGNLRHATQVTSDYRPLYKTGIRNNRSIARFDGSNDRLDVPSFTWFANSTVFIVAKRTNNSAFGGLFNADGADPRMFQLNYNTGVDNIRQITWAGIITSTAPCSAVGTYDLITARRRENTVGGDEVFVNGVLGTPANSSTAALGPRVYSLGSYEGATYALPGDICELIVFNTALSATNHNFVGEYLALKWGQGWTTVT